MSGDLHALEGFGGTARLFPLPNLVLFPHVLQPLHIFEPRYRQMMADTLNDDRLLALALLQPGWEKEYHKHPPIHPVVCLGRVRDEVKLADGRYNLLVQGICRARVVRELQTDKLYRTAQVELLQEVPPRPPEREQSLLEELKSSISVCFAKQPEALERLKQLWTTHPGLGQLIDILAFALPLEVETKQLLLQELDCESRTEQLLECLVGEEKVDEPDDRKWPPDFSEN